MLDSRTYIRVNSAEKQIFATVAKRRVQSGQTVIRQFIREYSAKYFVEEIQGVKLPAKKAFCDMDWAEERGIKEGTEIEVVFKAEKIEYNRVDNEWNEPVQVGSDRWDDIFENYPELLQYALDIK